MPESVYSLADILWKWTCSYKCLVMQFHLYHLVCWQMAILKYFSYFFQQIGFDISCKLSLKETICMNVKAYFLGRNKKNIINLPSGEFAQRAAKVIASWMALIWNTDSKEFNLIHQELSDLEQQSGWFNFTRTSQWTHWSQSEWFKRSISDLTSEFNELTDLE